MRFSFLFASMLSIASLSTVASAEDAVPTQEAPAAVPELKSGNVVNTADGRRVGRIERINNAKDGSPVSVSVIYQSRMVRIPVSTLTASAEGVVTKLTRAEVARLQ